MAQTATEPSSKKPVPPIVGESPAEALTNLIGGLRDPRTLPLQALFELTGIPQSGRAQGIKKALAEPMLDNAFREQQERRVLAELGHQEEVGASLPLVGAVGGIARKGAKPAAKAVGEVAEQAAKIISDVPGFARTAEQRIASGEAKTVIPRVEDILAGNVDLGPSAARRPLGPVQTAAGFREVENVLRSGKTPEVVPGEPTFGFQTAKFPEGTQAVIETTKNVQAPRVGPQVAPLSIEDQAILATELGPKVLRDLPKRGELSAKVARVRMEMVPFAQAVDAVASKPAIQRTTAETLDGLIAFRELAARQAGLSEGASEVARTLNQLKTEVGTLVRLGGDDNLLKAVRVAAGDMKNAEKIYDAYLRVRSDPSKLARLLKDSRKADFIDVLDEYVRANALWGTGTHILNVTSGEIQKALLIGNEAIADPQHAVPLVHGWLLGHRQIFAAIPKALGPAGDLSKYGIYSRPGGAIPGRAGEFIRTSYKALAVEDLFQRVPAFNAKLTQLAHRAADGKQYGLFSKERGQFVADFLADPPDEAWREATRFGREAVLQADNGLVKWAQQTRQNPLAKPFMLFVTAPINAARMGMRFSPVGAVRPVTDRILRYDTPTSVGQAFRESVVVGSGLTAAFLGMLMDGTMTGLTPKSKAEGDAWRAQGIQPMSIRASEYPLLGPIFRAWFAAQGEEASQRWVSAYLLGPLLWPALLASATEQVVNERLDLDMEDRAVFAAQAAGRTVLEQIPTFQGFQGIQRILENPLTNGPQFIANLSRLAIPASTALSTVARWQDALRRDPETIPETMVAQLPDTGFGTPSTFSIRPLIDVLGRDVPNDSHGSNALIPRSSVEAPHPVLQEMERLLRTVPTFTGFTHPEDRFQVGEESIRITPDQLNELKRYVGQGRDRAITALLLSPEYAKASDTQKADLFQRESDKALEAGKRAFGLQWASIAEDPDDIVRGTWIAMRGNNFAKAEALNIIRQSGKLSPGVAEAIDAISDSDLTVSEYLHGYELVDAWRKTPAFTIGTPEVWTVAKRARDQYMELIRGQNADERSTNAAAQNFYFSAAAGWLNVLYAEDGDKRDEYLHPTRVLIAQDKSWGSFRSAVAAQP